MTAMPLIDENGQHYGFMIDSADGTVLVAGLDGRIEAAIRDERYVDPTPYTIAADGQGDVVAMSRHDYEQQVAEAQAETQWERDAKNVEVQVAMIERQLHRPLVGSELEKIAEHAAEMYHAGLGVNLPGVVEMLEAEGTRLHDASTSEGRIQLWKEGLKDIERREAGLELGEPEAAREYYDMQTHEGRVAFARDTLGGSDTLGRDIDARDLAEDTEAGTDLESA
jgi:carbon monoxide dehydrogenase subunit G